MKFHMGLFRASVNILVALVVSGCATTSYHSDLKPGKNPNPSMGPGKFKIADVQVVHSGDGDNRTTTKLLLENLVRDALSARPALFGEGILALPLSLNVSYETRESNYAIPVIIGLVTLGVISIPVSEKTDYTISIGLLTPDGPDPLGSAKFRRRDTTWCGTTPLVLMLPLGGFSRISIYHRELMKETADTINRAAQRAMQLSNDVFIESLVKALGESDAAMLAKIKTAYDNRKSRLQSLTLDGNTRWGFVDFCYSKQNSAQGGDPRGTAAGASARPMDVAFLSVYTAPPPAITEPIDATIVAKRGADGRWIPCKGYLMTEQQVTVASVMIEDGKPGKVVLETIEEPPLDDFLDFNYAAGLWKLERLRWSNGVLLQVKNRSLARLLREKSGTELLDLVTRIERVILELDLQAGKSKDLAQAMKEKGEGSSEAERTISVLYQQRIVILKSILGALKQAVALKT